MLATECKVSVFAHNQATSALLFLCREVLEKELPWLTDINRPAQVRRIPSVLTKGDVACLLAAMDGCHSFVGPVALHDMGGRRPEKCSAQP